ncbi:MAG TPA: hypothetical protein VH062_28640 [Polyangiaceae bacterium]|jgi:hypothetical protein|nr:hypothetical protein [Polyangiaceae bacterium]
MTLLPLCVAALFVAAAWASTSRSGTTLRAALGVGILLALTAAVALSGVLADTSRRPPAFGIVLLVTTVVTVLTARSSLGASVARLPLWALVGAQSFRLPLELVMHRAATAGVMPVEMTFTGLNFDIFTGVTALLLGIALATRLASVPRIIVIAWNVMGSLLLAIVVTIALLTSPFIKAFGPHDVNVWVLYFPYVWLPTVLVQAALFGHFVIFRRVAGHSRAE